MTYEKVSTDMVNEIEEVDAVNQGFMITGVWYARMKFAAMVLVPALSTLYFTLGTIWGLPAVEQVVGTLAALNTFQGVLLGISNKNYNASDVKFDGTVVVETTESGGKMYTLELNSDPELIDQKKSLSFKVDSDQ
jgi:Putative phage holin Dp-1